MTLCNNKTGRMRIKLFFSAQTASLLLLDSSQGSSLSIVILFPRLSLTPPWLVESCDLIGWPRPFLGTQANFSPWRQEDEALGRDGGGALSEHTSRPAGPHSDADVLPSDSFADAISSAVWLSWKAPVSTSPERRWCTNIISVVIQAAFTGRKLGRGRKKQRASSWSNNAAIVAAVFTGAANNHLFIIDWFLQNCKYEGDFFFTLQPQEIYFLL